MQLGRRIPCTRLGCGHAVMDHTFHYSYHKRVFNGCTIPACKCEIYLARRKKKIYRTMHDRRKVHRGVFGFGKMQKRLRRHVYDSLDREFGPSTKAKYNPLGDNRS